MNRKDELLKIFEDVDDQKGVIRPLIDDVVFLEEQLSYLRTLPMIRVNPTDKSQQKVTPAQKEYKEFLQQYSNCIKILSAVLKKGSAEDESPLRAYVRSLKNDTEI